jgi:hypothetical protein
MPWQVRAAGFEVLAALQLQGAKLTSLKRLEQPFASWNVRTNSLAPSSSSNRSALTADREGRDPGMRLTIRKAVRRQSACQKAGAARAESGAARR